MKKLFSILFSFIILLNAALCAPAAQAAQKYDVTQRQQYNCVHGTGFNFDSKQFVYSKGNALYLAANPNEKGVKLAGGLPSPVYCVQLYGGYAYYVDTVLSQLKRIDLKTKQKAVVLDLNNMLNDMEGVSRGAYSCRFFIYKDVIYYNLLGSLYRVEPGETESTLIDTDVDPYWFFYGDSLCYLKENRTLKAYSVKSKKLSVIKRFKSTVWLPCIDGKKAYITTIENGDSIYRTVKFYTVDLKTKKQKKLCRVGITAENNYLLMSAITKNGKLYMTTETGGGDRFCLVVTKKNRLNYNKFSSKYKYIGGFSDKTAAGYYKNSIIANEYKTVKNAEKNNVKRFAKLV